MTHAQGNLDAKIHNVIKRYMSKRDQGRCMEELREALGTERSFEHHVSHGVVPTSAEAKLRAAGAFKGAEDLRRFADSREFWDDQPYGTRLYFDSVNYLHRDIVQAAVRILDAQAEPERQPRIPADTVSLNSMCQLLNDMLDGNDEVKYGLLEPWKSTYARLRARLNQPSSSDTKEALIQSAQFLLANDTWRTSPVRSELKIAVDNVDKPQGQTPVATENFELNRGEFVGAIITVGLAASVSLDWATEMVEREANEVSVLDVFDDVVEGKAPGRYAVVFNTELEYPDSDGLGEAYHVPHAVRAFPVETHEHQNKASLGTIGDTWIKCADQLPTEADADFAGNVIWLENPFVDLREDGWQVIVAKWNPEEWDGAFFSHIGEVIKNHPCWMRTRLTRPILPSLEDL